MISIEKINYQGWANSWQVTNGEVELVVTGDVGPRVMRYGFAGGQNFFKEFAGQMGKTGEAALAAQRRTPRVDRARRHREELRAG